MTIAFAEYLANTDPLQRAFIFANPEFPTDVLPVIWGNLTGGAGGVSYCPCIDTVNHVHLISYSEIVSAAGGNSPTFYADRVPISPASWDESATVDGHSAIATVTFSSSQVGKRIGYRGQGSADLWGDVTGTDTLVTNPISVIYQYIRRFFGPDLQIDTTAFAVAEAFAAAQGYACAGVLDRDRSPNTTVAEILSCFAGMHYLDGDGRLVVRLDDGSTPALGRLAAHIREHDLVEATARWDRREVINQVAVEYCRNSYDLWLQSEYQAHDDGAATAHTLSQSLHGVRGPGYTSAPLQWPWVRDATTRAAVQAIIVNRLAWSRPVISSGRIPNWRYAHLEPGDHVGYTWPRMHDEQQRPLRNQIGLIEGVAVREDGVELTIRDTGSYLMTGAARDRTEYAG